MVLQQTSCFGTKERLYLFYFFILLNFLVYLFMFFDILLNTKREDCRKRNITLVTVPFWWDDNQERYILYIIIIIIYCILIIILLILL